MTGSGAWIQSADRTPAFLLSDGSAIPAEQETERQELIRRISLVTSDGRRATWGDGATTYLLDLGDEAYDVVFEAPRPGVVDPLGRGVMSSLVVSAVTAADADQRLAALRQAVLDRGFDVVPLPADVATQIAGLIASGRRGCLPVRPARRHTTEA